jgi:NADP-dependent 3-hydroxy acid dehydrogenase YdfG
MSDSLNGQIFLIMGATSGIDEATARRLWQLSAEPTGLSSSNFLEEIL